ncbi:MAG: sporulation transcription factor Spo0A [Clostridiales bacterium]|nr:sporulation transcription factor Spo0A [Clostridiales bacterium]
MLKRTVFLLQGTKDVNEELAKQFENQTDFEVVGMTTDGISAISAVADKKPGILLTDLVVSGYDGLSVVRKVKEMKLGTKVVVLTAFCSDDILSKAVGAGADYFLAKPIEFSALKERLNEILEDKADVQTSNSSKNFHQVSLEEKISKIFINVGIPPHIKGYSFLREGVKMAVDDPEIINNITKKLYPSIGEKYNTTASKVERAIRHAIEVAWNRGRIDSINNILGVRAYIGAEKPTNGEFIALVADKMLLEKDVR